MKQLIDKTTIVAEIKKRLSLLESGTGDVEVMKRVEGVIKGYKSILSFIDTLETKEVDLNEEYIEEIYSHIDGIRDTADRMTTGNFMHHRAAIKFSANVIEKVLGLIGLKAEKGE